MKAPKLAQLAADINRLFPDLVAIVYRANEPLGGFCNTDRKIPGIRLRRPGRGRRGSRLVVSWRRLPDACEPAKSHHFTQGTCDWCGLRQNGIVFEHNAAETYRTNSEVVDWIRRRKEGAK